MMEREGRADAEDAESNCPPLAKNCYSNSSFPDINIENELACTRLVSEKIIIALLAEVCGFDAAILETFCSNEKFLNVNMNASSS